MQTVPMDSRADDHEAASEPLRPMTGLLSSIKPSGLDPRVASSARPWETVRVAGLGSSAAASESEE